MTRTTLQRPRPAARPVPPPRRPAAVPQRPAPKPLRLGDPQRRFRVALLVLAFVLSLFVGRLLQVQGFDAPAYALRGEQERVRTISLPAIRGTVSDRDGAPLAQTVPARTVTADPVLVGDPAGYARVLAPLLKVDETDLVEKLSSKKRRYVVLARGVGPQTWRQIKELQVIQDGKTIPMPGLFSEPEGKRVYPGDALAGAVVGFVNREGKGVGGLELKYDELLAGRDGTLTYERSPSGRRIATAGEEQQHAVPGRDLRLTLDRDIQWVAQNAIAKKVMETKAESGTVVVMDARTGEILAMATAPTFDPNQPGKAPDADRGNRALSEVYEPGSVAKIMTMAAVLEEGVATPLTRLTVPGELKRGDKTFHDYVEHDTWQLTLAGVLAKSSNIGTVLAAEQMSKHRLYEYLKRFGVATPTGMGFPGESAGILPPADRWSVTQRHTVTFGQGVSLNAVQVASTFATIANDGVRVAPSLVAAWEGEDGQFYPAPPTERTRVVSERTARQVAKMMEMAVSEAGTGPQAAIPGYRVAGKTGTAQRVDPECGCYRGYTASFAGFAPADDARLVVSVALQKPQNGHTGGGLGGPVFKEVMEFALQHMGVPPTGRERAKVPIEW